MNGREITGVIIDAGHGGNDPGAVSGNYLEKNFTLQAAQYIYNRLAELGIPAKMTREEDVSLPKEERIAKVRQLYTPDESVLLISNHINAGGADGQSVTNIKYNN